MTTIFNEKGITVQRDRSAKLGTAYLVSAPEAESVFLAMDHFTDDALLAVLLDRAIITDSKEDKAASRERVTMLKTLKSGTDVRGKAKRGPGRPRKDA